LDTTTIHIMLLPTNGTDEKVQLLDALMNNCGHGQKETLLIEETIGRIGDIGNQLQQDDEDETPIEDQIQ